MMNFISSAASTAALLDSSDGSNPIKEFVVFFYSTFIAPIFQILRDTDILGYPLFNWLFGLTFIALAVKFFRAFLSTDNGGK